MQQNVGSGYVGAARSLVAALLMFAFGPLACETAPPPPQHPPAAHSTPTLEALEAELATLEPGRVMAALLDLYARTELQPARQTPAVAASAPARRLLLHATLDLLAYTRAAAVLADVAQDPTVAGLWADERRQWTEVLSAVYLARGNAMQVSDHERAVAEMLRPIARALLHSAPDKQFAQDALAILNAIDAASSDATSASSASGQLLLADASPLRRHGAIFQASEVARAMAAIDTLPLESRARELTRLMPQLCSAQVLDAWSHDQSTPLIGHLRRRCALICTHATPLGDEAPPLPPLAASIYQTCPGHAALDAEHRASYLGVDNELAVEALHELVRLEHALRPAQEAAGSSTAGGGSPAAEGMPVDLDPFASMYSALLQHLVVPGAAPFLLAEGPDNLVLAAIPGRWGASTPTRAIAVVTDGQVRLAAWPRFAVREGRVVAVDAGPFAFPGEYVIPLDVMQRRQVELLPSEAGLRLRSALLNIYALQWPASAEHDVITVFAPANLSTRALARALRVLRAAGITTVQLAAWQDQNDQGWPAPRSQPVAISEPPARSPRLLLKDGGSLLMDPLGRSSPIPMESLRRFLPDVYARVADYFHDHPGLKTLVVQPDGSLDVETLIMSLVALDVVRSGDIMESTAALFDAPAMQQADGPSRWVNTVYLGLDGGPRPDRP